MDTGGLLKQSIRRARGSLFSEDNEVFCIYRMMLSLFYKSVVASDVVEVELDFLMVESAKMMCPI